MVDNVMGKGYQLVMENREKLTITGVRKVQSFDPKEILLDSGNGLLSIKGDQLGIDQLDLEDGIVEIQGRIDSLIYLRQANNGTRQSLWGRIFR
ncbi:MAG TPA: sporulation protein YabP [Desulfitobacteriaceae bacterium]|nr:sporulation protein YabP [Desulfitobacteriaceae bacterium]